VTVDRPNQADRRSSVARAMWEVLEPYHAVTYFAPESRAATDQLGLRGGWMGYFASRAAPLGTVPAEVVIAIFYHFPPTQVRRTIPAAWSIASPAQLLAARLEAVDRAIRRLLGHAVNSDHMAEAALLAREAADHCELAGRPLFAANAALPWPAEPHLVLWTSATRLREHRADGHIAALLATSISPCEAQVTISATGVTTGEELRRTRWWSESEWAEAEGRLRERGWLDENGALTERGITGRQAAEQMTDHLASAPWNHLGEVRTLRLWQLMRDLSERIIDQGGIPIPNAMGLPWPPASLPKRWSHHP
jgi:hypothetical protein